VNRIGIAQGVYYLMTALWPFFSLRTFIAVTGPKTDIWLVKTVGSLLVVIGIALIVGSNGEEIKPNTICLGVLSALALALVDIYYALRKIISKIYLGEAAVELIFVFLWIGFLCFGNLTNPSR
jgi:drug/metabolite transporter (DMT)-like permease